MFPVILTGCWWNTAPTLDVPADQATKPADDSLASVDAAGLTTDFVAERRSLEDLARQWRSDAVLHAVTISFPGNLARGRTKEVYVFGSATAPTDWWTVSLNETTSERIRALIPREDYLGPTLAAIPMEYWKLNPIEALQIAEGARGKEFRAANPGAEVTATLMKGEPNGWLWWVVKYRGLDNSELAVRIHPASGEIYDDQGEVTNPSSSPTQEN